MPYIFLQGNYAIYICLGELYPIFFTRELCHIYLYKGTMRYYLYNGTMPYICTMELCHIFVQGNYVIYLYKGTMPYYLYNGTMPYICIRELCHIYLYKGNMPYIFTHFSWALRNVLLPKYQLMSLTRCREKLIGIIITVLKHRRIYSHVPHNDVSVNDGPHIRRWSHNIII